MRRFPRLLAIILAFLAGSLPAWAAPVMGRWMLYGHAGCSIQRPGKDGKGSAPLPPEPDTPGVENPDALAGTFGTGAATWLTPSMLLGAELNYLTGASLDAANLYLSGLELGITLKGAWVLADSLLVSAGVGCGPILAFGPEPRPAEDPAFGGLGFSWQALVSMDYFLDDRLALGLDGGYRRALIHGALRQGGSSQPAKADYSGPILRFGLRSFF